MSEPFWHVGELAPLSPWLDACAPRAPGLSVAPLANLVRRILLAKPDYRLYDFIVVP